MKQKKVKTKKEGVLNSISINKDEVMHLDKNELHDTYGGGWKLVRHSDGSYTYTLEKE